MRAIALDLPQHTNRIAEMEHKPECCDFCSSSGVSVRFETQQFEYGGGDDAVLLTVDVPVYHCAACDSSYTGEEAEDIRHAAVCRHLGRLTPEDIRAFRDQYSLTQSDMADLTGHGIASIKRWETGNQIQNLAIDRYLRLARIPQNIQLLKQMESARHSEPAFKTNLDARQLQESLDFKLRPSKQHKVA